MMVFCLHCRRYVNANTHMKTRHKAPTKPRPPYYRHGVKHGWSKKG